MKINIDDLPLDYVREVDYDQGPDTVRIVLVVPRDQVGRCGWVLDDDMNEVRCALNWALR